MIMAIIICPRIDAPKSFIFVSLTHCLSNLPSIRPAAFPDLRRRRPASKLGDMSEKTLFSKIIDREIPAEIEHEDEHCIAFRDIDPKAPVHVLVVPRKPVPRIAEAQPEDVELLGHLLLVAARTAKKLGLDQGFRVVVNNGPQGGESVPHLHVHLLGGRKMAWPPG
jgi:histidine triad (HIT) family protein